MKGKAWEHLLRDGNVERWGGGASNQKNVSILRPDQCVGSWPMLNNRMYSGINRWAYFRERKAPFATTLLKNGGGLVFEGALTYFWEITVLLKL